MSVTAIVFWLVFGAGLCAALARPICGVLVYILVYHVNPDTQWWNVGPMALHVRPSLLAALATIIGIAISGARLRTHQRQFPLSLIALAALVAVTVGGLFWGLGVTDRGLMQLEKIAKVGLFVAIMIRVVTGPAELNALMWAWLVGLAYIGYQAWGGVGVSIGGRLTQGVGGPDFAESSTLAAHLTASLPLIGAMFFCVRRWPARVVVLGIGALTVNTIILTRTRNVLAGLAVLAIAAIPRLPRGYRLKGVAAVIAGTVLAVQLTDPGWWERMRSLGPASGDAAITTRLTYWQASLQMVADHPLGIGIGNYHDAVRSYLPELGVSRSAHSTYHECLAELGYAGFALFSVAILAAFIELRTASRLADHGTDGVSGTPALRWQALAIDGALAAYLGCALFVTRFFSEDLWLLVGMACCAANVARARQSVKRDAPVAVPQLCAPVRGAMCRPVLG